MLVDTDILVDHPRGVRRFSAGDAEIGVSVVTRAELCAGQRVDERRVDMLLAGFHEFEVDRAIAERAGGVARTAGIPMPDALIAATAPEHGLTLVTRNRRHFEGVVGLEVRSTVGGGP
jgi:predicted nucleic acid-binding protein